MPIGRRHASARIDNKKDRVSRLDGGLGLRAHTPRERGDIALFKSSGVDDREREIGKMRFALTTIARHAGTVIYEGEFLAHQPVEQRRFADVGPADDGDGK